MIVAVDTNILLDILLPDKDYLASSKKLLESCLETGLLILSEAVYCEIASQFEPSSEANLFLTQTGIRLVQSNEATLESAGDAWKRYSARRLKYLECPNCGQRFRGNCQNCGSEIKQRSRIIVDFMIGAHALNQANMLLTRDRGFYRAYFPNLALRDS